MKSVGAYEAKTHLARLLEDVARGESIQITRHGSPVALLIPISPDKRAGAARTIDALRAVRSGLKIGRVSVKKMIEDGRR